MWNKRDNQENFSKIIKKIPCPHCSRLCTSQVRNCPKCGEPLPKITLLTRESLMKCKPQLALGELSIIKSIELHVKKSLKQLSELKPNSLGYTESGGDITGLSLFKCGLEAFPIEILKLTSLKKLYLRRNKMSTLPQNIGLLIALEELDLRINALQSLPGSIGLLSNLKNLNVSSNNLFMLPKSIENLSSLKRLYLNNNKLKTIPSSFKELKSLKILNLKANFWLRLPEGLETQNIKIIK